MSKLILETKYENIHSFLENSSMVLDLFTAGGAGVVIDTLDAMLYFGEYVKETNPREKNLIFWEGILTLGSILLPAFAQTITTSTKKALRLKKLGKKLSKSDEMLIEKLKDSLKNGKIKEITKQIKDFAKLIYKYKNSKYYNEIYNGIVNDNIGKGKEQQQNLAKSLTYISLISEKVADRNYDYETYSKIIKFDLGIEAFLKIGEAVDSFLTAF